MKILIDQNISFRLKARIEALSPDIHHVKDFDLINLPDPSIFEYARREKFDAILTLDEDFHNLILERGIPPKIIWLRTGNCRIAFQTQIILNHQTDIQTFIANPAADILEIYR